MASHLQHPQRPTYPVQVPILVNTNAGIPWMVAWQPPHFAKRVPVNQMQTEMLVDNTGSFPVLISGQAWDVPFWEPYFSRSLKPQHFPTEFQTLTNLIIPVGIGGIAFHVPWQPPHFAKAMKVNQMQTEMFVSTFRAATVVGIAWWYPFDQPKQKKANVFSMPFSFYSNQPPPKTVPDIWWYTAFDQPKQVKFPDFLQITTMANWRPYPVPFAKGYIIGPA